MIPPRGRTAADTRMPVFDGDGRIQTKQPKKYPINVMVIDDEPDILTAFKATLFADRGFNVETFQNSQEALKRFTEVNRRPYYDVVITDIRMPKPNGIQLYPMLKEVDPNIKVLFVSALDAADELTSIFPDLESNVLKKPFKEEPLLNTIKRVLGDES